MSLASQVSLLATRIGQEIKANKLLIAGKANATHTHVATTDLTATGTKDSTTFLRGDNTWATPAGGSGSSVAQKGDPIVTAVGPYFTYPVGTATTVGAQTLNQTRYVPVYFAGGTLSEILFRVSTAVASSTLRIGIYNSAGANGMPGALVADYGQQAASVAGFKSVPVSTVLTAGWYWVATNTQVAAANVGVITVPLPGFPFIGTPVAGVEHICYVDLTTNAGAFPTPASTTMTAANAGTVVANAPRLWFKYSAIS